MKRSTYTLTVRSYELESFGHVNNSVYLQYSEAALWDFLISNGLADIPGAEGLFPVILESSQRYIHELKMSDTVRIETELNCSGGIVTYRHDMINERSGLLSCRVRGKLAYVDRERIICDIPDKIRSCIGRDEDEHC